MKRNDILISCKFGYKFRLIDDLAAISDGEKFEVAISENWNSN